jgi:Tfp pilus assembly protein PilP
MRQRILALTAAFLTASCGPDFERPEEFVQRMQQATQDLRGRVDPLPALRSVEAMTYRADNLPDPFYPVERKQR